MLRFRNFIIHGIVLACFYACQPDPKAPTADPTWSADIAPIIYKNCTSCHRPGAAGTFNLLTYHDAVLAANRIRFATQSRFMPPWPADNDYTHFAGEKVLSDAEITLIKNWTDHGSPRGDSTQETKAPVFYAGSFFGKPDLVIKLQKPVHIKGNGTDTFLMLKYPYRLDKDTFVQYVEFVPVQRKLVHHVNGHLLSYDPKRLFNYFEGDNALPDALSDHKTAYQKMNIAYGDHLQPDLPPLTPNVVYYLPGYFPPVYNEDIGGFRLKKNGIFFLKNIHYGPSNADVTDSSYINVFFRKGPPKRPVAETQMGTFGISAIEPKLVIPPNEVKTFHTEATLQNDISVLSVNPHMHLLGKTFWAFALGPDKDTIPLIRINKWDFRWQYYYSYLHPVKIPKGSTIHVYGTFDNTDKNPFNPFHPPRQIEQGEGNESMRTTEEMFQFIFTYMPYKVGDENISLQ
ncbi:MAG: monooxygenase [Bacteroidia bacterium]